MKKEAFTLIEMVVSLAITVVIASFLFSFSSSLSSIWRSSDEDVDTELDANIALDQIQLDLESAYLEEGGGIMFAVTSVATEGNASDGEVDVMHTGVGSERLWLFPGEEFDLEFDFSERPIGSDFSPDQDYYGWAGSWMRFFSVQPSLNAVSYQIIRRSAFSESKKPRYLLHRSVLTQEDTLKSGLNFDGSEYELGGIGSRITRPSLTSVLLPNVVDFGVRLYVVDKDAPATVFSPSGLRLVYPKRNDDGWDVSIRSFEAGQSFVDIPSKLDSVDGVYPDYVEVILRVLSKRGADLLYRAQELEQGEGYLTIVADHSKVYRRLIRLKGVK